MALKRPPQHRVDAEPVYVDEQDSAWDIERIKRECAEMRREGQSPSRHPVAVYHRGESRFDLGAAYSVLGVPRTAADYLGPDATRFVLRRLSHSELYRMTDMGSTSALGRLYGCRVGLVRVEGDGPKVQRDDYGVTDESLDNVFAWGAALPAKIGLAVFLASQPLTEDEKKA